jgi:hypothetical protein
MAARGHAVTGTSPWPALGALVVGFFMILVDATIVSPPACRRAARCAGRATPQRARRTTPVGDAAGTAPSHAGDGRSARDTPRDAGGTAAHPRPRRTRHSGRTRSGRAGEPRRAPAAAGPRHLPVARRCAYPF